MEHLKSDSVAKQDLLARDKFANEIAQKILHYAEHHSDSLLIGINGPWGSGKSTLMSFVCEKLNVAGPIKFPPRTTTEIKKSIKTFWKKEKVEQLERFQILEFNPWLFSGKPNLPEIFLEMLISKVGTKKQKNKLKWTAKADYWHFLDRVNPIVESARAGIKQYLSLQNFKTETSKYLEENDVHLVVVIDDLDRLLPVELLAVFQIVKQWGNFSNTIFLLAFDKQIVAKVFEEHYKIDGLSYLEKIVQVDYNVPIISREKIESMFFKGVNEILEESKIPLDITRLNFAWISSGISNYFENIRDLNRYFNALQFRFADIHLNIDVHDFLVLEAIRLFDFPLYEFIRFHYRVIKHSKASDVGVDINSLGTVSAKVYHYLLEMYEIDKVDYRLRDLEYFDRYFSYEVSQKDMREEDLRRFLSDYKTQRTQLIALINDGKAEYLLRRIATDGVLPKNDIKVLNLLDPLIYSWENQSLAFAENSTWRLAWDAIQGVIKAYGDLMTGYRKLIDRLSASSSQWNPAVLVFNWKLARALDLSDPRMIDNELIKVQDLLIEKNELITTQFKRVLETYKGSFTFSDRQGELYERIFFPSYARYFPKEYEEEFNRLIKDETRIFRILDILVKRDSTTGRPFTLDPTYSDILLKGHLNELFRSALKKINTSTLSISDGETIEYYLKHTKTI